MFTKEEARDKIKELTEGFEDKIDIIKSSNQYKEAQIEDEFIKPLFKYLNWNISNEGIKNPGEREFIVQAKGRNGKEPDYLLQLDNKPKFYIEAKHTKYDLTKRTDYIWQAYSYAYSTQTRPTYEKVDFALLTDFEEFRFFDCTFPAKNNAVLNNYCVIDWMYTDFIDKFDKLWEYFERENVRNGSLEKLYLNEKKLKENRIPPDKAFLEDLDHEKNGWRIKLAKDIKKYHPDFSAEFITQAVQLILDRFIFIKVLADREIEEDLIQTLVNKIQKLSDKEEGIVFEECRDIFHELDRTYNGSIFTQRSELDSVKVSNKVLLEILKDFLPSNSRYNFKVIPIEILGTIYEQFLGKVVVTSDKRAKIDYKPEVRKAGGVYYTPDYIVNYIVEKTVGEKLKNCKKFEDLLEIKICDPACGSGSFLIAAFDALIQWTIQYYEKKVKVKDDKSELKGLSREENKLVYLDEEGNVRLTSKIKRDILKSCIYGVDIDAQAVEVTKMSLSLKALEDTNHYEVHNERTLFHTTILPSLEGNIKCGNSLVGMDFFEGRFDYDLQEMKDVKPFDWNLEYKLIFENGGFDCIIGNPPYIRIQTLKEFQPASVVYYKNKFKSTSTGNTDIYIAFLENALKLMSSNGLTGYILPHKFFQGELGNGIRKIISEKKALIRVLSFGEYQIFENASTYTCLFFMSNNPSDVFKYYKIESVNSIEKALRNITYETISSKELEKDKWNFYPQSILKLFNKLELIETKLGDITRKIFVGLQTSADKIFVLKENELKDNTHKVYKLYSQSLNREIEIERDFLKPFLMGKDVKKYEKPINNSYVIFPYKIHSDKAELMTESYIKNHYPLGWKYLKENKKALEAREKGKFKNTWWQYGRLNNLTEFNSTKILTPEISLGCNMTYDERGEFYHTTKVYSLVFNKDRKESDLFFLGILNSKLLWFYLKSTGYVLRGGFFTFKTQYLSPFPIKIINFENNNEKELHDNLVKLVSEVLKSKEYYNTNNSVTDKKLLKVKIDSIDKQIDSLVYQLYNLTPEEIKIVEGEK